MTQADDNEKVLYVNLGRDTVLDENGDIVRIADPYKTSKISPLSIETNEDTLRNLPEKKMVITVPTQNEVR